MPAAELPRVEVVIQGGQRFIESGVGIASLGGGPFDLLEDEVYQLKMSLSGTEGPDKTEKQLKSGASA